MQHIEHDALEERWRDLAQRFEYVGNHRLADFVDGLIQPLFWTGKRRRSRCDRLRRCRHGLTISFWPQADVDESPGKPLDFVGAQTSRMSAHKVEALLCGLPDAAPRTLGQAGTLQAILSPACAILVDRLESAGQHFRLLCLAQTQQLGDPLAGNTRVEPLWMLSKKPQQGLDELIVGRDCHCSARPVGTKGCCEA